MTPRSGAGLFERDRRGTRPRRWPNSKRSFVAHRGRCRAAAARVDRYRGRPASRRPSELVHLERIPAREASTPRQSARSPTRLRQALDAQGITRFYAHQARAIDLARAGKNVVIATGTASGKSLAYHVPILERLLRDPLGRRALSLPDQGARAGSASRAPAPRRGLAAPASRRSSREPTTATRRARRAASSASRRTRSSPTPTCSIRGSSRITRGGAACSRTCATSSSTRCTPTAASSARTWRTCSAGCAASRATTARIRASSSPPPPSETPASWRSCSWATTSRWWTRTARRAGPSSSPSGIRAWPTSEAGGAREHVRRGGADPRRAHAPRRPVDRLHQVARLGRADLSLRAGASGARQGRARGEAQPLPRRLSPRRAPRHRAPPLRRRAARRDLHQRARAGDRRRLARRRGARRLSQHHREHVAAGGARGPVSTAPRWRWSSPTTIRSTST